MLGDLIILVDSLSISLDIGLSIILKAGAKQLRWLWGAVARWSGHLQLKQETQVQFPAASLGFSSSAGLLVLMG